MDSHRFENHVISSVIISRFRGISCAICEISYQTDTLHKFCIFGNLKPATMRVLLLAGLAILLFCCNSSSKKEPNQAKDDTARMDNDQSDHPVSVIQPVKISTADIPAEIKVKGKVQEAWKWSDALGENILVASWIKPYDDKDQYDEGQTSEVHAYHYARKENEFMKVWTMNDEIKVCVFDIKCGFIKN